MSTTREEAMAALRDWSTPGRRADLLLAAWLEGETNINALAEAARVTRPTVYADLRSRGVVSPDQRPKEYTDMTTPITIDGMTGLDGEADGRTILNSGHRYADEHGAAAGIGDFESGLVRLQGALVRLQGALRVYNRLRPLLAKEERARLDRDRALHQVEMRWEALNTAANWLAAHHAYIVGVDEARVAIDTWAEAATSASSAQWFQNDGELWAYEERILGAGHPRIELPANPGAERNLLRSRLDATHAHRTRLTAQTLGLAKTGA